VGVECQICSESLKTEQLLQDHLQQNHDIFRCPVENCQTEFSTWALLLPHIKSEHPNIHGCEDCPKTFPTNRKLCWHRSRTHGIKKERCYDKSGKKCSQCDRTFNRNSDLSTHIRLLHSGQQTCKYCQQVFPSMPKLMHHLRKNHLEEKSFACDQCPKTFSFKNMLALHQYREHDVPLSGTMARRHIKNQNGPLACSHCERKFARNADLATHLRLSHSGEQTCKYCQEKFPSVPKLMIHLRMNHLQEKDQMCEHCSKTFAYRVQLAVHQEKAHGVPMPEGISGQSKYAIFVLSISYSIPSQFTYKSILILQTMSRMWQGSV
jgi:KRAB domain-containing zinc finger protein